MLVDKHTDRTLKLAPKWALREQFSRLEKLFTPMELQFMCHPMPTFYVELKCMKLIFSYSLERMTTINS